MYVSGAGAGAGAGAGGGEEDSAHMNSDRADALTRAVVVVFLGIAITYFGWSGDDSDCTSYPDPCSDFRLANVVGWVGVLVILLGVAGFVAWEMRDWRRSHDSADPGH